MKQMAGIKKRKLEYVLNAIVYCMWYYRVKFQEFSIPSAIKIGTILARCIHSAEHMENEHPKYVKRERKKMNDFWYDKENGLNINIVYDNFMWTCGFNGLAVALPILAVLARLCRDLSFLSSTVLTYLLVCVFICIIVGVIVAERMVFRKKRYLDYFELFEKEDKLWLKKWGWITLAFCIGPFVLLPLACIGSYFILNLRV